MNKTGILTAVVIGIVAATAAPGTAMAQDDEVIEEVVTIGSRSMKPRSAADSTVPIDVISGDKFNSLGGAADLTDNLKALVPSYTATPATGDGAAFVRPTSLRGTASDQTLVLVNGKRRHRSALVQFLAPAAGNGAHGVDIGMIPGIAVKSVEVLRDGAASQYGSDAIAGVINFVMKDASEGGQVQVIYGQHYEGEASMKISANAGFAAGDNGFVNISAEYIDNEALSRGTQRPVAQALIDAGVQGVGDDAPFGDEPFVQTWGRPQTEGFRLYINSGFEISDTAELYVRFGYADTKGRYRFFYRAPDHATFTGLVTEGEDFSPQFIACPVCVVGSGEQMSLRDMGFTGEQNGFTPVLNGDQTDASIVLGVNGEFDSGMFYDFSFGFGKNALSYFLQNTSNRSLGPGDFTNLPQEDFDVGGYEQKEINLNADFSLPLSDMLNLGFGAEWREETYTAIAGEPASYFGESASGLKGVTADDAVASARDNVALYVDIEHDVSDAVLVQYAFRYEDFSDFGDTINWKIATRARVTDSFTVRGAVSTGFHAPTPGQANVRTTITTADSISGLLVEEGLLPPTSEAAVAVGGTALKEETSINYSFGFASDIGDNTTLTVDFYQIEVDDRIYKTGNIPDPATGGSIAFYTNALDVKHSGLDVVLTTGWDWGASASTDLTFAFSYTKTDVTGQTEVLSPTGPILPVSASNIEDIENNYPNERFVLTANTAFSDDLSLLLRVNYYGEHFDERGEINGTPGNISWEVGATVYLDVDLAYQLTDNWRINVGAINILDEFVDIIPDDGIHANRIGVGLPYPRRSAANYEGGQWYLRGTYAFE
ncbi:MAG: TonB-dependent receptor [Proteobacteria bacterium]|nr:TonB-dependent receptor [Pseudomonadota bacterium]